MCKRVSKQRGIFFLIDFFLDFFARDKNFIKWQSYSLYSMVDVKRNLLLIFIIIKII